MPIADPTAAGSGDCLVAIRADASVRIGGGHVARCRNLAVELRRLGAQVLFLSAELDGSTARSLLGDEWPLRLLPAGLTGDAAGDARASAACLDGRRADWLVVDHYGLDCRYESALRPHAARILVLDDLADRPHDCELLLDQNLFAAPEQRYRALLPAGATCLLGPRYALLPPGFAGLRPAALARRALPGAPTRLLLFFGATDPAGACGVVLEEIAPLCRARALQVDVVLGSTAPQLASLRSAADRLGARLHVDTPGMASLLAEADVALGAGGTANWERCAMGIPTILCSVASNQTPVCESLAARGAARYLGEWSALARGSWTRALEQLLDDRATRESLGRAASGLVDGLGAQRVAREMLGERALQLRPATVADCDDLLAWRNDAGTRAFALDPRPIEAEQHRRWFMQSLADSARALLVAEAGGSPVGVLRFDLDGDSATVSVYLVPAQRGAGWGAALLRAGALWLRRQRPGIRRIHATILAENRASVSSFRRAGYRHVAGTDYLLELDCG